MEMINIYGQVIQTGKGIYVYLYIMEGKMEDKRAHLARELSRLTGEFDTDWFNQPVSIMESIVDGLRENQSMVVLDNTTMDKLSCLGDKTQGIGIISNKT